MASGSSPSGRAGFKIRPLPPENEIPTGGDRIGSVNMTVSNIYTFDNLILVLKQRYNVIKLALLCLCNYTMRKQFSPFVIQFRLNDRQSF